MFITGLRIERQPNAVTRVGDVLSHHRSRSVKFENSAQLVELGLMKTSKAYEESVQMTAAARLAQSA